MGILDNFIFHQDNYPKLRLPNSFWKHIKIKILGWPPSSPDSIENLWMLLDKQVMTDHRSNKYDVFKTFE